MHRIASAVIVLLLATAIFAPPTLVVAQDADQIQAQIDKIRKEIEQLQKELRTTTTQKQSLQNAIKELDLQIQQLQKSISLTSTQIGQKDKEIVTLGTTILTTEEKIDLHENGVAEALRELDSMDEKGLAAALIGGATLASFFDEAVALGSIRDDLGTKIRELNSLKADLAKNKNAAEGKRKELASLQSQLSTQRKGLATTRSSQTELLKETQNKEAQYQALIAQKQAEQSAFEAALVKAARDLGSADTTGVPSPRRGLLNWPIDNVYITQSFGNTDFAASGAYNGQGHNGIDFRASIGTPIKAALSGVVQEVNQGAVKYCQYGKWVLVRHNNGLTSLYAHLSSISVSKGQAVGTGDVIGYAGDTGYATGPHLHFTVYASSGVNFKSYTCNSGYTAYIPIAPLNGYLNPMSYLPSL